MRVIVHFDIGDKVVRKEFVEFLEDNWKFVLETDSVYGAYIPQSEDRTQLKRRVKKWFGSKRTSAKVQLETAGMVSGKTPTIESELLVEKSGTRVVGGE